MARCGDRRMAGAVTDCQHPPSVPAPSAPRPAAGGSPTRYRERRRGSRTRRSYSPMAFLPWLTRPLAMRGAVPCLSADLKPSLQRTRKRLCTYLHTYTRHRKERRVRGPLCRCDRVPAAHSPCHPHTPFQGTFVETEDVSLPRVLRKALDIDEQQ
jgi:hypothetical protein